MKLLHVLPLFIFAAVLVCFVPALDGQFLNWDDDINFLDNHGFRGLGWAQLRWMWTGTLMGHYIPLTWMSLGLNYTLGGMNPWGYHLGNVLGRPMLRSGWTRSCPHRTVIAATWRATNTATRRRRCCSSACSRT